MAFALQATSLGYPLNDIASKGPKAHRAPLQRVHGGLKATRVQPFIFRGQRGGFISRSNEGSTEAEKAPDAASTEEIQSEGEEGKLAKEQITAVFTGAAAIALGVLYLGLVSIMDSRGMQLQPPPPEAYLP
ncbi:hypothetical protein CYMTET_46380 [Cymbomonas tetramitiformis]|uniref:Uncharacterized protein n=1 Tax=Cymbomonas tetramitiformis TaxID=36881 RepID=A0AAE0BW94_9CHLO|nr:hypothetical protein CYMTET_46380 [Cymbomonas tetramitiformis]